jgi:hypothetical protein
LKVLGRWGIGESLRKSEPCETASCEADGNFLVAVSWRGPVRCCGVRGSASVQDRQLPSCSRHESSSELSTHIAGQNGVSIHFSAQAEIHSPAQSNMYLHSWSCSQILGLREYSREAEHRGDRGAIAGCLIPILRFRQINTDSIFRNALSSRL